MINKITNAIRTYYTGKDSRYVFERAGSIEPCQAAALHLYIHVPFCKNLCPYCPYYKVPYSQNEVPRYVEAMHQEIEMYATLLGKIDITSIYVGGGTPTLIMDELGLIFEKLRSTFRIAGNICIETDPMNITDNTIMKLREYQVNLVSIGVQGFEDKFLRLIGRSYSSTAAERALTKLIDADFDSVNIDLLFALPGQSIDDVTYDLQKAIESGVHQITTYPLFTFPYTSIGKYLQLKNIKMPNGFQRRKLYYHIHEYLTVRGFERVSVWGFKRADRPRYSSVTRDGYLGLGPGAGSHLPDGFYLNTFSVESKRGHSKRGQVLHLGI